MSVLSLSLAREIAYDAFVAVMQGGEKPHDVLERYYAKEGEKLRRLDRNFIKEILFGGLRWYSKIFWILQHTSRRDLGKSPPEIQASLVLGAYQIYYMDRVPDRAAVNESVEYVRKRGHAPACSFVNGILRQIARRAEYFAKPDKSSHPVDYLALQFAHPRWLVDRWFKHFRFEKMEKMLAANNKPPPHTVRLNSTKVALTEAHDFQSRILKEEKIHSERRPLRSSLLFTDSPDLSSDSLFGQGFYTIQDESSQLIASLVNVTEGDVVVDACSGPGGKLSHLYELGGGKIRLVAVEKNEQQVERSKETFRRLGLEPVEWIADDFLKVTFPEKVSRVLLDAPCSGLGVLRRHPEGKWQKKETLITEMAAVQKALIRHALTLLRPGGELIYSVCSFEPEESEHHLRALLREHGDLLEQVSPVARLPDYYKKYVTRDNMFLVYGGNGDDMDGFASFILKVKGPFGS